MAKRRGHGEGTIYFWEEKSLWVSQISLPTGKRKKKYTQTQKEAKAWLLGQREAIRDGKWIEKDDITLSAFLERWMGDVVAHTLKPKTIDSYAYLIRLHIQPEIGNIRLVSLRPDHLQNVYAKKMETLSPRTVHYIHAVLHRALNQALRWGLVVRNVADLVDPPSPLKKPPNSFTLSQVKQLFAAVGERYKPLLILAVATGLREGELLGLYWSDLDLDRKTLTVRRAVQALPHRGLVFTTPKTEQANRTVSLPEYAVDALVGLKNRLPDPTTQPEAMLVFPTQNGTPISPRNLLRHFHDTLRKLGWPIQPFHTLRHTCASLHVQGTNPKAVQEILGHSSISLTLGTYSHLLPGIHDEAAARMSELLKVGQK